MFTLHEGKVIRCEELTELLNGEEEDAALGSM
jgi:hypothetical protein